MTDITDAMLGAMVADVGAQVAAVPRRGQPRIEHRDDALVVGAAKETADTLSEEQRRMIRRDSEKAVTAA